MWSGRHRASGACAPLAASLRRLRPAAACTRWPGAATAAALVSYALPRSAPHGSDAAFFSALRADGRVSHAQADEFEESVAQALFDLEATNNGAREEAEREETLT